MTLYSGHFCHMLTIGAIAKLVRTMSKQLRESLVPVSKPSSSVQFRNRNVTADHLTEKHRRNFFRFLLLVTGTAFNQFRKSGLAVTFSGI